MVQMSERQLRNEGLEEPILDPFVTEYGQAHVCPHCGEALSTVPCQSSCPFGADCEDFELHRSGGAYWCPLAQNVKNVIDSDVCELRSEEACAQCEFEHFCMNPVKEEN